LENLLPGVIRKSRKTRKDSPGHQTFEATEMPGVKAPALLAGIYKPCSGICVILFFRLSQYYLAARPTPLDGHHLIVVQERLDE